MRTVKGENCFQELEPTATELGLFGHHLKWGGSWSCFPELGAGGFITGSQPPQRAGRRGLSRWVLPCLSRLSTRVLPGLSAAYLGENAAEREKRVGSPADSGAAGWGLNLSKAGRWAGWWAGRDGKLWPSGKEWWGRGRRGSKSHPVGLSVHRLRAGGGQTQRYWLWWGTLGCGAWRALVPWALLGKALPGVPPRCPGGVRPSPAAGKRS